jgi:dUTP pyrophosphatase
MDKVTVKVKMLEGTDDLRPAKAHHDDAAYDLRSRVDMELNPGEPHLIPTGVFIELPVGYEAQVRPRSGLALKHALTVLNSPGTIDAGYRGEVCVIIMNAGKSPYAVKKGDRIAQMVISRLPDVEMVFTDTLSDSKRGAGGFGSTGKK